MYFRFRARIMEDSFSDSPFSTTEKKPFSARDEQSGSSQLLSPVGRLRRSSILAGGRTLTESSSSVTLTADEFEDCDQTLTPSKPTQAQPSAEISAVKGKKRYGTK